MIETSPEYKTAIQQHMRGGMEFRATVAVENIYFKYRAVLTDNGHLAFSNVQELITDREVRGVNVTTETNMYILDGEHHFLPAAPEYQGFVSDAVSGNDRAFTAPPKITITSDADLYDFAGLTLQFDPFNNDYPTDFSIYYYYNDELIKTVEVTDNDQTTYVSEQVVDGINKMQLVFYKTHNIHRRLRLTDIVFGVIRTFTGQGPGGIISVSQRLMIHPLMTEIPQNELTYLIRDPIAEYNPENPTGVWKYLLAGQEMSWDYFFNVSSELREHVPGGKFYLKNPPTTESENVRFQFTGLLQALTMLYTQGLYHAAGRTYYELFSDVLTFADLPTDAEGNNIWTLDERLHNYRCYLPLPRRTCAELIQILCQNTGCIPFEDTDGYLHIKLNNAAVADNPLNLTSAYEYPSYDPQLPPLRNILFTRHSVSVEAAASELHKSAQLINGTKQLFIEYAASTGQSASVSGGTLVSAKYYAYGCLLTITANNATVNITVTGRPLLFTSLQRTYEINPVGSDAPITMELLSDDTLCDFLAVVYAKYLQEIKRYKFEYLGDPARRANDIFPIDTRFNQGLTAQVISSEYTFDGGSHGVLEMKNYG